MEEKERLQRPLLGAVQHDGESRVVAAGDLPRLGEGQLCRRRREWQAHMDLMAETVAVAFARVLYRGMAQSSVPPERQVSLLGLRSEDVLGREKGALKVVEDLAELGDIVDDLLGAVLRALEEELASDDAVNLESLRAVERVGPELSREARIDVGKGEGGEGMSE